MLRTMLLTLAIMIGSLAHEAPAAALPATLPAVVTLSETVITVNVARVRDLLTLAQETGGRVYCPWTARSSVVPYTVDFFTETTGDGTIADCRIEMDPEVTIAPMESDLFRGADLLPATEWLQAFGINAGVYCDKQIYEGETIMDEFHTAEDCRIEIDDVNFVQPFGFPGTGNGNGAGK